MQLIIHRGTHEVGGSCIEIATDRSRIILDVGMPLFNENREPHDTAALKRKSKDELLQAAILPRVMGLFVDGSSPDAILLSHAHEDHTGLVQFSRPEIPIYASQGTSKMMLAGFKFAMQPELPRGRYRVLESESPVQIGDFTVTAFPVDHSIYGAQAFLIEADGKSILYSGDLRMHGRKPGMHRSLIEKVSDQQIDVLLMEGTHIGHPDHRGPNEYELEDQIASHIKSSPGLVLASFSPQHVDRLVGFLRATKKAGRIFIADAYTAFVMHLIGSEVKLPPPESTDWIKVFFPKYFEDNFRRKRLEKSYFLFLPANVRGDEIRVNPSKYVMVFRPSMLESDFGGALPERTRCLYSRWSGYLDTPDWQGVTSNLNSADGDLIEVHTSGHIFANDIEEFVKRIKAKVVIPIHTFEPERFPLLFPEANLLVAGEPWTIS